MLDSIAKLLAVIMVVILALVLLNLFGDATADSIPSIADFVGNALHQLWVAIQRIVSFDSGG
jgi:hypothetical protein